MAGRQRSNQLTATGHFLAALSFGYVVTIGYGEDMPSCDGRQAGFHWDYDRAEIIADGVVHAIGVGLGLVGAVFLLLVAGHSAIGGEVVPVAIYAAGLLAALGLSAAYNLWPVSGAKWLLRRFDHAAIYVLIAATYTPFLAALKAGAASIGLLIVVWVTEALASWTIRPALDCFLPASRLERSHQLSPHYRGAAQLKFVATRDRRATVLGGSHLPFMGKAALSERHLACVRGCGRVLSLYGSS
jgi:hypothetical protein